MKSANTSQEKASAIMGRNFFGIEEAIRYFEINPSDDQRTALSEIPCTEEVLLSCMYTHVLMAVFPLSILDMCDRVGSHMFKQIDWLREEDCYIKDQVRDQGDVSWQLVARTPMKGSADLNWTNQQQLLSEDEETPCARVMIYMIIGHYLDTNERLFERCNARCSDMKSVNVDGVIHEARTQVGWFNANGIQIGVDHSSTFSFYPYTGIAYARKL